jgi:hypothetical protein
MEGNIGVIGNIGIIIGIITGIIIGIIIGNQGNYMLFGTGNWTRDSMS